MVTLKEIESSHMDQNKKNKEFPLIVTANTLQRHKIREKDKIDPLYCRLVVLRDKVTERLSSTGFDLPILHR